MIRRLSKQRPGTRKFANKSTEQLRVEMQADIKLIKWLSATPHINKNPRVRRKIRVDRPRMCFSCGTVSLVPCYEETNDET